MEYMAFITPGWSYGGSDQSELNCGWVSWGLMLDLPVPAVTGVSALMLMPLKAMWNRVLNISEIYNLFRKWGQFLK